MSVDELRQAVERQHLCRAKLASVEPVKETFEGKTVWEGSVHVFEITGHPRSHKAYAWSSLVEGSDRRRFYAVLHLGGIRSPLDAVRAALEAERRSKGQAS